MLTVQDALSIGRLKGSKILAGSSGLDREIKSVTIMDIAEIAEWLSGGELLIAGVLFQQCFSRKLIDALMNKGIAGMVTKEKFTSRVPPELFEYCDRIGFPVVLAPADCNWGQIMNPIINHIVREPYLIIEEAQKFHDALMRAMIDGVSLSEICSMVYASTGMSLAITDNDLHLIGFSGNFDWKSWTRNISYSDLQYSGIMYQSPDESNVCVCFYTNPLLHSVSKKLLFYPVTLNHTKYGYIIMAADESLGIPKPTETIKIQQLSLFAALHSAKQNEISNATRRFNGLLMDQLLQESELTQERAEAILAPLGKKIHRRYYAVQFLYEKLDSVHSFVRQNNLLGKFHEMVENQISRSNHILIFEKSDSQILLIPYPAENFDDLLLKLRSIFLDATKLPGVYIGVSDPLPLCDVKNALTQSGHAANYLFSVKSKEPFFRYGDLGVLKFFMDNEGKLDESFLRGIYDAYITPLTEHDRTYHTELLETLELYINNNCSKTETEKQLFIHKNTLRARLAAINKTLNCDVDNVEDLFKIQVALKLRYFYDMRRKD
ncbi:MAG: hypothetical protein GX488_02270 [Clostridiales bacterium]|nr:hypothetical protein [Clostridiales bacterium]